MGFENAVCRLCDAKSRFCVRVSLKDGRYLAICFECIDKYHREHAKLFADELAAETKRLKPAQYVPDAEPGDAVTRGLSKITFTTQQSLFGPPTTIARRTCGQFIIHGERQGGPPRMDDPCWSVYWGKEKTPRRVAVSHRDCLKYIAGIRKIVAEKKRKAG